MARIDPAFLPVLTDLARGLRELDVPFCLIGALVPELLLDSGSSRMTNDTDVTVVVDGIEEFDRLKRRLAEFKFAETGVPHRLRHRDGGFVDVLPFSADLAPDGRLELQQDLVMNMAGFQYVVPNAVPVSITPDLVVPVAPVPLYVLLKLAAFGDRQAPKDLASVHHCLRCYLEDDDQRYGLDHAGEGVPFEYTCAYLLGVDCQRFLDPAVRAAARAVLDRFETADSGVVRMILRENGRRLPEPASLNEVFQLFRWFRLGAGLSEAEV